MNKRSKARWVRNLRDPKYADNQMYKDLANDNHTKFCALGVFIDGHSSTSTYEHKSSRDPKKTLYVTWKFSKTLGDRSMPKKIDRLYNNAGLTEDQRYKIIELNDIQHWTFPKIADYIEEHF